MLIDDKLTPEGNHEKYAQPPAEEGKGKDAGRFEVEAQEDQRGQGKDDARGDRLPGVADGLDDVVFKDAGFAKRAED